MMTWITLGGSSTPPGPAHRGTEPLLPRSPFQLAVYQHNHDDDGDDDDDDDDDGDDDDDDGDDDDDDRGVST